MSSGSPLPAAATALAAAVERRDEAAFHAAFEELVRSADGASRADQATAVRILLPLVATLPYGLGAQIAQAVGSLAHFADDALAALPILVDRALGALADADRLRATAERYGVELPDGDDGPAVERVVGTLAERSGGSPHDTMDLIGAHYTADEWVQPVLFLAQRKDARLAMPRRGELTAAIESAKDRYSTAFWLYGLLLVLDDEPLTVLHRATGRGFRLTMSGIGDNFQLHTLLADRLIGGHRLPGTPPTPAMVAAAETGDPEPSGGVTGQFNLVDAHGAWIWNEGRPADIPTLDGVRVVVLDPPPYQRGWNAGRPYPLMPPTLTVEAEMGADEAAGWLGRVKPPVR